MLFGVRFYPLHWLKETVKSWSVPNCQLFLSQMQLSLVLQSISVVYNELYIPGASETPRCQDNF